MPAPIPETIKSRVIEQWILGQSRDSIARANSIGMGTVTNIIREFEDRLGRDIMRGTREIGVLLKREGLTPVQCAIGFRIMKMFADQGEDSEAAEHFVLDIYKECNRLGIKPSNIVTHIGDLTKFSQNIRLPEINEYVNNKVIQKNALDEEIGRLNHDVSALKMQKLELESKRDLILEQSKRAEDAMKSYSSFKQEFESYGISMTHDIPKFASTIRSIAEYGYDPKRVIEEFRDFQYHQEKLRASKIAVDETQKELARLDNQKSLLLRDISFYSNKFDLYDELANMGFDIEKLKRLHDTIRNIAESNQISEWPAIDKFFKDIETQYDAKLGFESEKDRLTAQIQTLKEEHEKKSESLREQPFTGPIIVELMRRGFTEDEILTFGKSLLKISEGLSSVKNFALGMIDFIKEAKVVRRTRTTSDDKTIEILDKAREELIKLD